LRTGAALSVAVVASVSGFARRRRGDAVAAVLAASRAAAGVAGLADVGAAVRVDLRRLGVGLSGLALRGALARVLRVGVVAKDDEPVEGG
jgi:hypothetical protein